MIKIKYLKNIILIYFQLKKTFLSISHNNHELRDLIANYLGGGPVVRTWKQEVCSLYGFRFERCGCSYDGHWRLTWSLTSGPVGLVEVRASWPGHYIKKKKKKRYLIAGLIVTQNINYWCHYMSFHLDWIAIMETNTIERVRNKLYVFEQHQ